MQNSFRALGGQKRYVSLGLLPLPELSFQDSGHLSLPIRGQLNSLPPV